MPFVCLHGHFYQPPRENPWLEAIEVQDSAEPFHDWNERVTAECYRPNAWARVVNSEGFITEIRNNYSRISFNFGPTLLSWLESRAHDAYEAVLRADRDSRERFSGHGSAIAQAFNHLIMPLANRRDKITQIVWGIRDFERRFHRAPEGMWLPETAVDNETLGLLAENGIRFTILAPHQALRFRRKGTEAWTEAANGGIPTYRPYEITPPGGRAMSLFFYDGGLSHDIAFGGLLHNGEELARRIVGAVTGVTDAPAPLSHVATDGETYGHHHRHGEMALAFALRTLESTPGVELTNYGEFLEKHPPEFEVEIRENTSWSCAHGVERWRSNCGCNAGRIQEGQQAWRAPLREALDWLRDQLNPRYEAAAAELLKEPWLARDDYASVLLDRSPENVDHFLERHARRALSEEETVRVLRLLELQRHLEQMYTSCGWFFDDLGGIETVQILQYASRALQLAEQALGVSWEAEFKDRLAKAVGNLVENGDGAQIYDRFVRPARGDLRKVCGHYALSSLFQNYNSRARIYCYDVETLDRHPYVNGSARLIVGRALVASEITRERAPFTYGALYIGGHNLFGGVRPFLGDEAYRQTLEELAAAFQRGDIPELVRNVDRSFGEGTYSLRLLFRDEQRKIVDQLLDATAGSVEVAYQRIYETTASILRYLADSDSPAPRSLRFASEFVLNSRIRRALDQTPPDLDVIANRIRELNQLHLSLDAAAIAFHWSATIERQMRQLIAHPDDRDLLRTLNATVELARAQPLDIDLAPAQNRYYELFQREFPSHQQAAAAGAEDAREWVELFTKLGGWLRVQVA
jgi:alpha-amylase/alpha-mannosidase (GH57 family)